MFSDTSAISSDLETFGLCLDQATPGCDEEETPEDRIGPYYTPNAPFRTSLIDEGMKGTKLVIRGRVRSTRSPRGLAGAVLDVWQADDGGAYDNEGFTLRGKFRADASGAFTIETIVPGRYLDGDGYRPAHLHVIVRAEGHADVTTQLYFAGDPFNAGDVGYKKCLEISPTASADGELATFTFVLAPAARRDLRS